MSYVCSCCGEVHDDLPDLAFDKPAYLTDVPESEHGLRLKLSEDLCVVDDEFHFIRGVIEIPIHDQNETLGIGVWVSQKQENFIAYKNNFDTPNIGPFFGWLSNDFVYGGERTLNLKTMAYFRGQGLRPRIEIEPTDHPLAWAQKDGVSLDEAWVFIHAAGL
jgi:hypothetical protein